MTTNEFAQFILQTRSEENHPQINEEAVIEVAQLTSGSFTYSLYETLWLNGFDIEAVTEHLESMYDNDNHFGFIYFVFILADAVSFNLPIQFIQMAAKDLYVPILSGAIIEDWLEFDCELEEIPNS